jgi:hypothetical protein
MKEYLLNTIQCSFEVGQDKAELLYEELLEITRYKHMVIVKFNVIKLLRYFYISIL